MKIIVVIALYSVALVMSVLGIILSSGPAISESSEPGLYDIHEPKTWLGKPLGALLALSGAAVGAAASVISLFPAGE